MSLLYGICFLLSIYALYLEFFFKHNLFICRKKQWEIGKDKLIMLESTKHAEPPLHSLHLNENIYNTSSFLFFVPLSLSFFLLSYFHKHCTDFAIYENRNTQAWKISQRHFPIFSHPFCSSPHFLSFHQTCSAIYSHEWPYHTFPSFLQLTMPAGCSVVVHIVVFLLQAYNFVWNCEK